MKAGRDPSDIRRVLNGALAYVAKDAADAEEYRASAVQTQGSRAGERVDGLIGTVDEIIAKLSAYRSAGVNTFVVNFGPAITLEQIAASGRR